MVGIRYREHKSLYFSGWLYTALSKTLGKQEGKKAFPGRRNSPVKGWGLEVKSCAGTLGVQGWREVSKGALLQEAERRSAPFISAAPGSDFGVSVRGEALHPSFFKLGRAPA